MTGYLLLCAVLVFLCGCGTPQSVPASASQPAAEKFPVEKVMSGERIHAGERLASGYIEALNRSLTTGDFAFLKKVLPAKIDEKRALKIFESMRTGLARYGKLSDCRYLTRLDCTLYTDYIWKYKFIRKTGDPRMPEQIFEVLYRVRVIHPGKAPVIVKADFMFK